MFYKDIFINKKWMIGITITFLIVILIVISYDYLSSYVNQFKHNEQSGQKQINKEDINTRTVGTSSEVTLSPDSTLKTIYIYQKCGHAYDYIEKIPMDNIGLTFDQIHDKYPDKTIIEFSNTNVTLVKNVDAFCPEHYILKKEGEFIGVFQPEEKTGVLIPVQEFPISYDGLDDDIKQNLNEGIPFDSLEEIESMLEDLDS